MRFRRLGNLARRLANWLDYGLRRRCGVCGAYESHHAICPQQSGRDWEATARHYYAAWLQENLDHQVRMNRAAEGRLFWQARYHSLRLENNAMRKRIQRATPSKSGGPEQPRKAE